MTRDRVCPGWPVCKCPCGPFFDPVETEAARRRVARKRAIRRALARAGIEGVTVR